MNHYSIITDTKLLTLPPHLLGASTIIDVSSQIEMQELKPLRKVHNETIYLEGKLSIQVIYEENNEETTVRFYRFYIPVIALLPNIRDRSLPIQAKIEHLSLNIVNPYTFAVSFILIVTPNKVDERNKKQIKDHMPIINSDLAIDDIDYIDDNQDSDIKSDLDSKDFDDQDNLDILVDASFDELDQNQNLETTIDIIDDRSKDVDISTFDDNIKNTQDNTSSTGDLMKNSVLETNNEQFNNLDNEVDNKEVDNQDTYDMEITPSYSFEPEISPSIYLKKSLNDPDRVYLAFELFNLRKRKKRKFRSSNVKKAKSKEENNQSNNSAFIESEDFLIPTEYVIENEHKQNIEALKNTIHGSINQVVSDEQVKKENIENIVSTTFETTKHKGDQSIKTKEGSQTSPTVSYKALVNLKDNRTTLSFINLTKK